MKISKKEFKNLLKECLKEIFSEEGFFLSENVVKKPSRQDVAVVEKQFANSKIGNPVLAEKVQHLSNGFTGDTKMFHEIFEDTALTTLQNQHEGMLGGGELREDMSSPEEEKLANSELKNLSMNGDVRHWAKLAFSKKPTN